MSSITRVKLFDNEVRYPLYIGIGDQSITTINGRMSFCSRVFVADYYFPEEYQLFPLLPALSNMSDDDAGQSFGPGLAELVAEVENQMAGEGAQLGGSGGDLELSGLLLETSYCCQFAARVSSAKIAGLGDLLDVVLSQEFGKCSLRILYYYQWYV